MAMRDGFVAEIERIPGLHVWGKPELTIVSIGSNEVDIHRVAEELAGKGWLPGLLREPKALHMMMSLIHEDSRATYVQDLKAAVETVKASSGEKAKIAVTY
jgi:sphinganine-1-phosphate aldolase